MTVRVSHDEGRTRPTRKLIGPGPPGHCCLTRLKDGRIGLLCERDNDKRLTFVTFTLDGLAAPQ